MRYLKTLYILYWKAFKNRFSKNKGPHYQKFLIIGFARSGTTLLHTYLNSHAQIHSIGQVGLEHFNSENAIFPLYAPNIKAGGAKFLLSLKENKEEVRVIKSFIQEEPKLKILFLSRRNLLDLYVSYQIARKTKQWSQDGKQQKISLQDKQLKITVEELQQFLQEAEEQLHRYRSLLQEQPLLEISYEELSEKPGEVLPKVQNFLGVKESALFSLLQKQNPEPLSKLIINYSEVRKALKNTPHQSFLK